MDNAKHFADQIAPPVKGCSFCDHLPGLAVLPVRYAAVGPEGKQGAPALSGNFKIENAPAQLGGGAQYTLRIMRPGFLYVFHEALQHWDCYLVLNGGHLWKIIAERPAPPKTPTEFYCSIGFGHAYTSMYFTIPDPKHATTVWYAYSHVQWSQAQLDDNKYQPALRKKHMQSLDVKAWMGSHSQPHAARTTELGKSIATFAMHPQHYKAAFRYLSGPPRTGAWKPVDLIGATSGAILSEAMERTSPGDALMLAFNDPLAITEDLALLTYPKMNPKANNGVIWDKTTDFLLDSLEANIRANAIKNMTKEAEDAAARGKRFQPDMMGNPAFEALSVLFAPDKTAERWKRQDAEREATRLKRQQDAADRAWKPYADALDNSKRHPDLAARLKALNEQVLAPISLSHAQWLLSDQFKDYMTYRHDERDLTHGYHYNEALTRCVEHGMQNVECRKVVRHWFEEANPGKDSNLLARALLLNHKPIIDTTLGTTDQAYAAVLGIFKSGIDAIDATAKNLSLVEAVAKLGLVPRLAWILTDEIIPMLGAKLGSKGAQLSLYALSLFGGARVVTNNVNLTQIRAVVLADLQTVNPALYKQLGRTQRREEAFAWARRASSKLAQSEKLVWFDPRDLSDNNGLAALRLRTTTDAPGARQVQAMTSSRYVNIGAVSCILQALAVFHAAQTFRASGEFDEVENGSKLAAGLVSMAGTMMEQAGVALEKAPTHPFVTRVMRSTPQAEWVELGRGLGVGGRIIGFAGAAVGVGWDAYHFFDERSKGNIAVATLYGISSASGLMAAGLPLLADIPTWPFLLVLLGVNVVIVLVDDPAPLKWTQHCRFSKSPASNRYTSMENEWSEFLQLGIEIREEQ